MVVRFMSAGLLGVFVNLFICLSVLPLGLGKETVSGVELSWLNISIIDEASTATD